MAMAHGKPNSVAECASPNVISASALILSGVGRLLGVFVSAASGTPTITIYDNTAGSGTKIVDSFTPVAGTFYPIPANFKTGCYVAIGGTVTCSVFADPL